VKHLLPAWMILFLAAGVGARETPASAPASSPPATSAPAASEPEEPTTRPHSAGDLRKEELAEARRVVELHKRSIALATRGKYAACRPVLEKLLKIDPENDIAWYNLACVDARLGKSAKAMKSLNKAVDCGYSDLRYMEKDPDLAPLRKRPGYAAILRRNAEIQRDRAERIQAELTRQFGAGYICEIDHARKLVFATNIDRRTLEDLKKYLTAYAEAQWGGLFTHRFEQYVTIVVPKPADARRLLGVGGFYNHGSRTLLARQIGMVMTHEFTHALHDADQDGLGQRHPIWVTEGLATLFESSEIRGGTVVPQPNQRMNLLARLIARKKIIPFDEFVKLSHPEFMKRAVVAYPEARYLMMYLHERGLLKEWYDAYTAGFDKDPAGAKALEAVLGKPLGKIQADWLAWVKAREKPPLRLAPEAAHIGVATRDQLDGLRIMRVVPGSGADQAGLTTGDVIVKVDGRRVVEGRTLIRTVGRHKVGDKLRIEYRRDGQYKHVTVTLSALPEEYRRPRTRPADTHPATKKAA